MSDSLGSIDHGLHRVNSGHKVCPGVGIQAKSPGDPGDLPCGEEQPKPQEGMVAEHQHSGNKDRGLEEGRQTQPNDLFHPGHEAVRVPSGYAEHIETSHGDLNEQDAAPFQIGEEHLDDRVGGKKGA